MRITSFVLIAALAAAPAIADDSSSSDESGAHDGHEMGHGDHATMEGVRANAEIHSIDGDMINLTHEPIPEIGWPKMTMDLRLLEGAEIGDAKAGDKVEIMLERGPDGVYGLRAIQKSE